MRYPASEKLEIIRTVERNHLHTKNTLDRQIPQCDFVYDNCFPSAPNNEEINSK